MSSYYCCYYCCCYFRFAGFAVLVNPMSRFVLSLSSHLTILCLLLFGTTSPCSAGLLDNALVQSVSQSLNINASQAAGGIGSVLQLAGSNVSSKDFGILKQAIPDASALIAKAPVLTGGSKSDYSSFSEEGLLGGLAPLTSQFSALGLSSDMILPLVNKVLDYLKGNNSTKAHSILESALPTDLPGGAAKSLMNAW